MLASEIVGEGGSIAVCIYDQSAHDRKMEGEKKIKKSIIMAFNCPIFCGHTEKKKSVIKLGMKWQRWWVNLI